MSYLVQPRLVNDVFSDPGLFIDFRFGRRAILFDLGEIGRLSAREILRVSHVFVSHMHLDHFAGFDRLLRLNLYQERRLQLTGPIGFCAAVEAKLGAYSWNLLGPHSADFSILAADWSEEGFAEARLFSARQAFRSRPAEPAALPAGTLLDEADFTVEAATFDHGIPCLGFALQEKLRVNVHKARLDQAGLPVGPWLTEAKRAVRSGADPQTVISVAPGLGLSLRELLDMGALQAGPGQRIAYAVDMAYHQRNADRLAALAREADQLFIECAFLDADRELAAGKRHLTALQAGSLARAAGVRRVTPLHMSSRYLDREAELREELRSAFAGAEASGRANPAAQARVSTREAG